MKESSQMQLGALNLRQVLRVSTLVGLFIIVISFVSKSYANEQLDQVRNTLTTSEKYYSFQNKITVTIEKVPMENRRLEWLKTPSVKSIRIDQPNKLMTNGGSDAGGGMSSEKELLDFKEVRKGIGRIPFNPAELKILQNPLKKILNQGLESAPQFKEFVFHLLHQSRRNWFFVNGSLDAFLNTSNLHILLTDRNANKEVVALQNATTVLIKLPWLLQASELEQIGLFVHEGLMSVALDYQLPHDNVREMNRIIFAKYFNGSFPNDFEVILNQLGYMLPLQDYLQMVGEYSMVYSFHTLMQMENLIELEEAGGSHVVRIEPLARGQTKVIYRTLPRGQVPNGLIVSENQLQIDHVDLIWSGHISQPSVADLATNLKLEINQKFLYLYRKDNTWYK